MRLGTVMELNRLNSTKHDEPIAGTDGEWIRVEREIKRALKDLRYGSVEIVVHDSRVAHIERREKTRIGSSL